MASHLEPINAATKAVNNAMFDCQPYNAVHPHLQKKILGYEDLQYCITCDCGFGN